MTKAEEILHKHTYYKTKKLFTKGVLDAMKEYALQCCEASLKKAAENARHKYIPNGLSFTIDKTTITNPENIVLL